MKALESHSHYDSNIYKFLHMLNPIIIIFFTPTCMLCPQDLIPYTGLNIVIRVYNLVDTVSDRLTGQTVIFMGTIFKAPNKYLVYFWNVILRWKMEDGSFL